MVKPFVYDPANLRHRVTLFKHAFDETVPWHQADSQSAIATLWAGIASLTSAERQDAGQVSDGQMIRFVIRYNEDANSAAYLVYQNQRYDLKTITDPDQRKQWMILQANKALGHD